MEIMFGTVIEVTSGAAEKTKNSRYYGANAPSGLSDRRTSSALGLKAQA
jgi:hypothetical protein